MAAEFTGQHDLVTYLRVFWRWKFLLLAFVVLIPLGVFLVERRKPPVYRSSTLVELQDVSAQTLGSSGGPVVTGNLAAVARLVTTTPMAATAAGLLHESPGSLVSKVSADADSSTGFLTITAEDHDPARAAAIANGFAAALSQRQAAQANAVIDRQIRGLREQRAAVPRNDPAGRVTLTQQILQLQALRGSSRFGATVIQAATRSGTPVAPNTRRAVELALVIALLLGIGAVLVADNADRRLRGADDIESLTGWPLLAAVAPSAFSPKRLTDPRNEEAFQMLASALMYFNVERPLGSVAIVSPQSAAGKTTVAVGLAVAMARAGKRAILVDADLRRPQVKARMGLPEGGDLGAVLTGERELSDVLMEFPVESANGGRLLVLGAGSPPPNPAALLSSQRMMRLMRELESQSDLVIVDTVAALAVGDALPLLRAVSGNVVVIRMNRTSRAAVRRLQKVIASARGTVLGSVATGSGAAAQGYGGYGYYHDGRRDGVFARLRGRGRRAPSPVSSNGARPVGDLAPQEETNVR